MMSLQRLSPSPFKAPLAPISALFGPSIFAAACGLLSAAAVRAEAPMTTDDAGTLAQSAMKLEANFMRQDKVRAADLIYGVGLWPGVELGVALARLRDTGTDPRATFRARGFSVKWVPRASDEGWSLGARWDMGRVTGPDPSSNARITERDYAITALASYRLVNAQVLHLNAGHQTLRSPNARLHAATWAAGYEFPVTSGLQLTAEVYGAQRQRPDKAIGMRYALIDNVKLSAAVGRGNSRTFGQVGAAWEF